MQAISQQCGMCIKHIRITIQSACIKYNLCKKYEIQSQRNENTSCVSNASVHHKLVTKACFWSHNQVVTTWSKTISKYLAYVNKSVRSNKEALSEENITITIQNKAKSWVWELNAHWKYKKENREATRLKHKLNR